MIIFLLSPVCRGKHNDNGVYLKTSKNHAKDQNPFSYIRNRKIIIYWSNDTKSRSDIANCGSY